eukprot:GGOE01007157.1.p1 GENE.GGOE01007157.1~~GGOE01007157.1.p1  ORF type:complete len:478 (-),score=84.55 GGOE01007157.1:40-1473(-)
MGGGTITALAGVSEGGYLPCPSCGKAGTLPSLDESASNSEDSAKCGPCEVADGAQECLTCGFPLCTSCVETHKRPAYRHHEIAELGSLAKRRKVHDVRTCKEHDEETKLYCRQCNSLVCVVCVRGQHDIHPCPPVAEAVKAFPRKDRLVSCFQEALVEVGRVDQLLVDAEAEMAQQLGDNVRQCKQALQVYLQQMEADAAAKAEGIVRQRVALTAIRQRLTRGLALADAAVEPAEQIHLALFAKAIARDVTRSLVSVPTSVQLTESAVLQSLPSVAGGDGRIHKLTLRGMEALIHDVYEFSPETPDTTFVNDKRRVGSSKVVTVLATNGYTSGVHQWQIRVSGVPPSQLVGVAPVETPLTGSVGGRHGYFLSTANGRVVSPSSPGSSLPRMGASQAYCHPLKTGTVVHLCLDMDRHTLSFAIDGKDAGVAFDDLPSCALYPAVSFVGGGCQWAEFVEDTTSTASYSLLGQANGPSAA